MSKNKTKILLRYIINYIAILCSSYPHNKSEFITEIIIEIEFFIFCSISIYKFLLLVHKTKIFHTYKLLFQKEFRCFITNFNHCLFRRQVFAFYPYIRNRTIKDFFCSFKNPVCWEENIFIRSNNQYR